MAHDHKPLLVILEEAGGFEFLAPCLSQLKRPLYGIFSELLIPRVADLKNLNILPRPSSSNSLTDLMRRNSISDVLVGTGWGEDLCRQSARHLKGAGIPFASFVDHWTWFRERFSEIENGSHSRNLELKPNVVFVVDDLAKQRAIDAGFLNSEIRIVGHPGLERSLNRAQHIVPGPSSVIGFISENYSGDTNLLKLPFSFNQFTILTELIEIAALRNLHVIIRPHPQEDAAPYAQFVEKNRGKCSLSPRAKEDFFSSCGILVGMQSMLLLEGAFVGMRAISYQPGLRTRDTFVGNILKATQACYELEELAGALTDTNPWKNGTWSQSFEKSAERMTDALEKLIL